jgi:uncharacterized damage-inducible protein DinB
MSTMPRALASLLIVVCSALLCSAQTSDGLYSQALSMSMAASARSMHATIRRNLAEAAALMPPEDYAFKPTPQVRSFGELVAHVAAANFFFCAQIKGEKPPSTIDERGATTKPVVVKALNDSLAYCDAVYSETTDANFAQPVQMLAAPGGQTMRGTMLGFNTTHNNEHYGNLVVYLRLKGHVPPSTTRRQSGK